jgi:hypothetical protein
VVRWFPVSDEGRFESQNAAIAVNLPEGDAEGTHLLASYQGQRRFSWASLLNFSLNQLLTSF